MSSVVDILDNKDDNLDGILDDMDETLDGMLDILVYTIGIWMM